MLHRPVFRALLAHLAALLVTLAVAQVAGRVYLVHVPPWLLAAIHGLCAGSAGYLLGLDRWWIPINIAIPFAVLAALFFDAPAWIYLAAFGVTLLVFRNVGSDRVPLYLSNAKTRAALIDLVPQDRDVRFIDLGCGLGGTLVAIGKARLQCRCFGVETAPIPYFFSKLRVGSAGTVNFRSLWDVDLSTYDFVYCFLSPEPMTDLFAKAKMEMRPGSLFVSNSFGVPGNQPDRVIDVPDSRKTRLLLWQM
ncbi:MAG: class I SAM-dependent methyltransferase [Alphaproteobacteria bacterium]